MTILPIQDMLMGGKRQQSYQMSPDNCESCGKPLKGRGSPSLTQWIFGGVALCSCSAEDTQADICPHCHKYKDDKNKGSITQWVMRSNTCKCDQIETHQIIEAEKTVSTTPKRVENTEPVETATKIACDENLQKDTGIDPQRYLVVESLEKGSWAHVVKCFDNYLKKYVAIKILTDTGWSGERIINFQTEAKILSQFNNPNIIQILDLGITENENPYMVMDLIAGETLSTLVESRKYLSKEEILLVMECICNALEYAHQKGFTHGDLSPRNILCLTEQNKLVGAKLIDFGLSRILFDETTGVNILAGTPHYMSPEQFLNKKYDIRSDIYSLGCISFFVFSGKPPFWSSTDLAKAHVEENPPSLNQVNGEIEYDQRIEQFVFKSLSKDPDERHQTAEVFYEELKESFATEIVEQKSNNTEAEEQKTVFSKQLKMTLTGFLSVLVITIIYLAFEYQKTEKKIEKIRTTVQAQNKIYNPDFKNKEDSEEGSWDSARCQIKKAGNWVRVRYAKDKDLKELKGDPSIKCINIRESNFDGTGFDYLKDSRVLELDFTDCTFSDSAINKMTTIKSIRCLGFCRVNGITTDSAKALTNFKNLQFCGISSIPIDDQFLKVLSNSKTLANLVLTSVEGYSDKGLLYLKNTPSLYRIEVSGKNITRSHIEALSQINSLTDIGLSNIEPDLVDRAGPELLKKTSLLSFQLMNGKMSEPLLGQIRKEKQLGCLVFQNLEGLKAKDLSSLSVLPKLVTLGIGGEQINTTFLDQIKKIKTLNLLQIRGCPLLTQKDLARFRKDRPDCKLDLWR